MRCEECIFNELCYIQRELRRRKKVLIEEYKKEVPQDLGCTLFVAPRTNERKSFIKWLKQKVKRLFRK